MNETANGTVNDMNRRISLYAVALGYLATGAAPAQESPDNTDADAQPPVYELDAEDFEIDREGERCINTRNIRGTDVLDERTILFRMRGGDYFVNYLRNDCPGLVREERFSYRTSGGRLCQVDMIRVLEQFGGFIQEGMSCGLGAFYPISEDEADLLALEPEARRGGPSIRVTNPDAVEDGEAAGGEDAGGDGGVEDPDTATVDGGAAAVP